MVNKNTSSCDGDIYNRSVAGNENVDLDSKNVKQLTIRGHSAEQTYVTLLVKSTSSRHQSKDKIKPGERNSSLPDFRQADIELQNDQSAQQWVTYKEGVYDVTEFVKSHPGGKQILLAAGGQLEPFWNIYNFHHTNHVLEQLEQMRIGNIDQRDLKEMKRKCGERVADDPFSSDPERNPALLVNSSRPFDAEPHSMMLVQNFITPNDLFFVRNHFPVPDIVEGDDHILSICDDSMSAPLNLSVSELRHRFQEHTITTTIQCAGNRRKEMNDHKPVKGLSSDIGAISTAEWTGVRLADVLQDAGLNSEEFHHVVCQGADKDMSGLPYEASIPSETAFDKNRDVLLAYQMNSKPLPRDHGYPLRLVVPGTVGVRQVKWLTKIKVSKQESLSQFQQNDYKGFNSSVDWTTVDWTKSKAIQEYPVQSAICDPTDGSMLDEPDQVIVRGYAWSGGGRGIIRVDVSIDGGLTWLEAELEQATSQRVHRQWAWSLWEATLSIPDHQQCQQLSILCKATDSAYNSQPERTEATWNLGGFLQNAWHRVNVTVPKGNGDH